MPIRHFAQRSKKAEKEQNRFIWPACWLALPLRISSCTVTTEANMKHHMFYVPFRRDVSAQRLKVMFTITDRFQNSDLALVGREPHFPCLYLSKWVSAPKNPIIPKGSTFQFWEDVCRACDKFCKPKVHNAATDPAQTTEFRNDNSIIK